VKKLELEFSFDPLFKKASADFDEGGAKGLLLNHLSIDSSGRIVFDSSDDKKEGQEMEEIEEAEKLVEEEEVHEQPTEIASKLAGLRNKYFPDLSILDSQHICSATKGLDLSTMEGIQDIPFLKALEDRNDKEDATSPENDDIGGNNDMAFGFDDGFGIGGGEDMTMAFGEGGEAWANETIADAAGRLLSPSKRPQLGFQSPGEADLDPNDSVGFGPLGHSDILSYFDEALKTNWAGPEHWRIRRIKDNTKPANAPVRARKEKAAFSVDFMDPAADVPEELLASPKSEKTIELPKKDRVSKTRHLLPDDKHFNSRQLIRLFLKPKTSIIKRKRDGNAGEEQNQQELDNLDEKFWAEENLASEIQASSTPLPKPNYDANFFNDDAMDLPAGLGDDDDNDAELGGAFSPGPAGEDNVVGEVIPLSQIPPSSQALDFGVHLVTQARRTRPEYVQYARVAKKVDVRKLKENLWNGLKFEGALSPDRASVCASLPYLAKAILLTHTVCPRGFS
jgi:condensin complex subunit 2